MPEIRPPNPPCSEEVSAFVTPNEIKLNYINIQKSSKSKAYANRVNPAHKSFKIFFYD